MRPALIAAMVTLIAAGAQAKPAADPDVRLTAPAADYAIAMAARGAMLESDYFKAPTKRVISGTTCRLYFDPFEKERLAAICR
jgi:hypothetical protein